MDPSSIAAVSGMRSRMQSLDLLANNIANSGTAGFKNDVEYFGLFNSEESDGASNLPNISKQWTDFSQGPIEVTSNPLDVAISGQGFFAAKGPHGTLYTRNGHLQKLSTGELASPDGFPMLDTGGNPIKIPSNKPVEISSAGVVTQDGQPLGQFQVVQFKNLQALTKVGGSCFQNTDTKNLPTAAKDIQVQQGKIEGSNVPTAQAAMRLVGVMRQFEMLQKAVGISSEMDTKSIQEVARVGS